MEDIGCQERQSGGNPKAFFSKTFLAELWPWVIPPVCRLCGNPSPSEEHWCPSCRVQIEICRQNQGLVCQQCGLPTPASLVGAAKSAQTAELPTCERCLQKPPQMDRMIAPFSYQGKIADAIVAAKYSSGFPIAMSLADDLSRSILYRFGREQTDRQPFSEESFQEDHGDFSELPRNLPDLVTAVPAHFTRSFLRGGNGVAAIATRVARRLNIPFRPILRTTRRLPKQAWLDDAGRRANVSGAFDIRESYALTDIRRLLFWANSVSPSRLTVKHVLVVDDVMTTGATGNEISNVLKRYGVEEVTVATVARALRKQKSSPSKSKRNRRIRRH